MQHAQTLRDRLTLTGVGGFTSSHMQRLVLVLIGIVLVERAYDRSGG